MFQVNRETPITAGHITKFIELFKQRELPRLLKLDNYYKNENGIKQRTFTDTTKPNNRIAHSWANYITDTMTAFFLGEPVSYQAEDEPMLDKLNYIFDENDEQDLNSQLARDASKFGKAYELAYIDEQKQIRFTKLSVLNTIPIYDDTVHENLLYVIRFNEVTDVITDVTTNTIEIYNDTAITTYRQVDDGFLEFVDAVAHNFEMVPISIFKNNDDEMGDYETVMDLIDLYDRLQSDTANANDYYNDCYLVFEGASIDDESVQTMKENRILEIPEGGKAYFLTKDMMGTEQENVKNRVVEDIHKFSKVPNMSDEQFANNVSGVAMKYKLLGLENACSIKERKFKRGLQNRLWLISNIMNIKTGTSLQEIKINFKRNMPMNEVEIADYINKLRGLLSTETLISQLTFVEDVAEEMEKLEAENALNSYNMPIQDEEEEEIETEVDAE